MKKIQSQLNAELRRLCTLHGIPLIWAIRIQRFENGRVCIVLAFANDVRAAKAAQDARNANIQI